ncbi:MAG TPA: biotin carboxylase N-terminal domain-containing protein [Nocardioides sp.]|uniref:acetyl/propionyl/methylcrotonyl-CoA carboxylase subunit alpha n=1 Tax=Nocardioides sp. TaxID=35761 RepID=UPI002D800904|nr:biotin carboxylase N-terminal domain-containing protein [Nocardioides sp.]HET6653089.1 biotin carboxylase N-terminal domain-containing protein [Nocardioides sp.]
MTIQRLLVANRGEIASRVFASCRRLGIGTVAVHADADAGLPYVAEADLAVRLPGDSPADTYLRPDLLVEAALAAGADAVHPGYGFLSENAAFARKVIDAGLAWVGPDPESIELMGSKVEAKKRMADAGVPLLADLDPAAVSDADLPVLVKASAGGGGRGMRVVRDLGDLPGAVEAASAEALSAFGDGTVFVERFVEHGRHVEVQVVGDAEGVVVFGDRDCSVQRRHQKVVEEAPAPGLTDTTRRALHAAARAAAEAIGYRGAGTVEFLLDPADEQFWFLEMNTRLQVEHPVTELVHGVDLVEQQLRVAEGSLVQRHAGEVPEVLTPRGHAMEARLYAEDPSRDWQPQSGVLTAFDFPVLPGVRVDAGYAEGSTVTTHYDAMLAKVVAHAPTRDEAVRLLASVLAGARIHGVATNRDLLLRVLRAEAFRAGDVSTDLLDRHGLLLGQEPERDHVALSAFAAAVALAEHGAATRVVQRGIPVGWRNVVSSPHTTLFGHRGGEVVVAWLGGAGYASADGTMTVVEASPTTVVVGRHGVRHRCAVAVTERSVDVDSALGHIALRRTPRFVDPADQVASGSLLAPMPGSVVSVSVTPGAEVGAGQPVLVLEAMKMQHTVTAPHAGVVSEINVSVGDQVAAGDVLAVVEEEDR